MRRIAPRLRRLAADRGEVRPDVTAAEVTEAIAGITLMGLLTRVTELDDVWIDRTTTLLLKGIST